LPDLPKFTQIWIFGLKTYHLASLVGGEVVWTGGKNQDFLLAPQKTNYWVMSFALEGVGQTCSFLAPNLTPEIVAPVISQCQTQSLGTHFLLAQLRSFFGGLYAKSTTCTFLCKITFKGLSNQLILNLIKNIFWHFFQKIVTHSKHTFSAGSIEIFWTSLCMIQRTVECIYAK
jgi:hypothetical protein